MYRVGSRYETSITQHKILWYGVTWVSPYHRPPLSLKLTKTILLFEYGLFVSPFKRWVGVYNMSTDSPTPIPAVFSETLNSQRGASEPARTSARIRVSPPLLTLCPRYLAGKARHGTSPAPSFVPRRVHCTLSWYSDWALHSVHSHRTPTSDQYHDLITWKIFHLYNLWSLSALLKKDTSQPLKVKTMF